MSPFDPKKLVAELHRATALAAETQLSVKVVEIKKIEKIGKKRTKTIMAKSINYYDICPLFHRDNGISRHTGGKSHKGHDRCIAYDKRQRALLRHLAYIIWQQEQDEKIKLTMKANRERVAHQQLHEKWLAGRQ